ncbi:hypothetical protein [Paenibacillus alkalitolerans]|uniref:hypothetical protein n=1 Tax=Paenibacillus alkalitolerans TaxID=2799335 RepID=UPI0018F40015|nr:hypothetical protein [Paenibacillus alkalitolerans]
MKKLIEDLWNSQNDNYQLTINENTSILFELESDKRSEPAQLPFILEGFRRDVQHENDFKSKYRRYLLMPIAEMLEMGRKNNRLGRAGIVNLLYVCGELKYEGIELNDNVLKDILKKHFSCFHVRDYLLAMKAKENISILVRTAIEDLNFWAEPRAVLYVHLINEIAKANLLPVIPHDVIEMQIYRAINMTLPDSLNDRQEAQKILADLIWPKMKKNIIEFVKISREFSRINNNDNDNIPRVALCISGQLRGWKDAFLSWKKTFMKGANIDLFVHVWEAVGRTEPSSGNRASRVFTGKFLVAYQSALVNEGYEEICRKYPTLISLVKDSTIVRKDELQQVYDTNYVVVENEQDPLFEDWDNSVKMHYKIWSCHQLMKQSGNKYDIVVRMRPDHEVVVDETKWNWKLIANEVNLSPKIFANSPLRTQRDVLMGDQFAMGSEWSMDKYANTWVDSPKCWQYGAPWVKKFIGHTNIALQCYINGIIVRRTPSFILGKSSDSYVDPFKILTALRIDIKIFTDLDMQLLKAAEEDCQSKVH